MNHRELLELGLQEANDIVALNTGGMIQGKARIIVSVLRDALAQDVAETNFGNMEPVAYWIPKAEQFCIADKSGRPFAKAWEPLYALQPTYAGKAVVTTVTDPAEIRRVFEIDDAAYPPPESGFAKL